MRLRNQLAKGLTKRDAWRQVGKKRQIKASQIKSFKYNRSTGEAVTIR